MKTSTQFAQYDFPTKIVYGRGVRTHIVPAVAAAGQRRPILVTDRRLAELPLFSMIEEALQGIEYAVFSGVDGNPVKSQVVAGAAAFRQHGADCLIAVGGGSSVDVAKAIAVAITQSGDLFDYAFSSKPQRPIDGELPFIVAVPTTAGTGSEVGRSTVISDDETHVKYVIGSPKLLPGFVAADPELHLGLPPPLTAATGMDALTHLIEAYLAADFHPLCDGVALHGIHILSRWLPVAYDYAQRQDDRSEQHLTARGMMLNAAIMGAVAFQKGLGLTHSCAHALSTVCDLHHGLANGVMIDYCMAFNCPAAEKEFIDLARAANLVDISPEGVLHWLRDLKRTLDIPAGLAEAGVSQDALPALVHWAMRDGCHALGPKAVTEDDFRKIFSAALA